MHESESMMSRCCIWIIFLCALSACVSKENIKDEFFDAAFDVSLAMKDGGVDDQGDMISSPELDQQISFFDATADQAIIADMEDVSIDVDQVLDVNDQELDMGERLDQSYLDADAMEDAPTEFNSTRTHTHTYTYQYDRSMTSGNPLQGFTTNYGWGEPQNDFPHSLEFRYIPLSDLIHEGGQYRFEQVLEPILNSAVERNHHSILRFYLDYPALPSGIPSYLEEQISCTPYNDYGGGCSPDYQNPQLQAMVLSFIESFGANYDGDPRIAFIQIGLLGFWGEWHTYPYNDWFADQLFQQEVITTFDTAFSITPIQLRIPAQDSSQREIGFHDDSFAYSTVGQTPWFFWPRILDAQADTNWQIAPMGGEIYPALQANMFSSSYQIGQFSQDPLNSIQTTHMSYLLNYQAFNLNGSGYTGDQRDRAEQVASALGYEFTVDQITTEAANINQDSIDLTVSVSIKNSGVAPFYYPLQLQLRSNTTSETWTFDPPLVLLLPNTVPQWMTIELSTLPISVISQGFTLSLFSPHLLSTQVIKWANIEQENGRLLISNRFICHYDSASIGLADMLLTDQGECFCDVDGQLYTHEGIICSE